MDITNSIIDPSVLPLKNAETTNQPNNATDAAKKKFAMDFESVFVNKLVDEMKNTVQDLNDEKDGADQQAEGLFWMFLGQSVGSKGGLGLWKDIYKSLDNMEQKNNTPEILDKKI